MPETPAPLILASSSRYRQQLLARLQLRFDCEAPNVDEGAAKITEQSPPAIARTLARQKAEAVRARHPDAIVIGSDQVATIDDRVLDKPGTVPGAIAQLQALQGREHTLLTAVAVLHRDRAIEFTDVTRLRMRTLTTAEIQRYIAAEQPLDCAGSYKIEGLGIALFAAIDCEDQTAIVGLPLLRLCAELRALGCTIP